jgi:hypothetical protein
MICTRTESANSNLLKMGAGSSEDGPAMRSSSTGFRSGRQGQRGENKEFGKNGPKGGNFFPTVTGSAFLGCGLPSYFLLVASEGKPKGPEAC